MKLSKLPEQIYNEQQAFYRFSQSKSKLFPHIKEQYEYRITNRLLIQKIVNPRRDKIIMDSLANASSKYTNKNINKNSFTNNSIQYGRNNFLQNKEKENSKSSLFMTPKDNASEAQIVSGNCVNPNSLKNENQLHQPSEFNSTGKVGKIRRNITRHKSQVKLNYLFPRPCKYGQIVHQKNIFTQNNTGIDNILGKDRSFKEPHPRQQADFQDFDLQD